MSSLSGRPPGRPGVVMIMLFPIVITLFLAWPAIVFADTEIKTPFNTQQLDTAVTTVGALEVDGVGQVTLTARRINQDLFITAHDAQGNTLGQAKSLVGLRETSIYLKTPEGLEQVTILWGRSE